MKIARKICPPLFLALSLFLIYLGTMAPGLSWANGGTDGGDLITAAATGGVAHPTGYPTYLMAASLFQGLPVGTLAFRTNLFSAAAAVLAAVVVYGTVVWLPNSTARGNWLAGVVAGMMFGLAPLVWSQAVISEVYTLHALFVAVIVALAAWIATMPKAGAWDGALGVTLGLAVGNHLTAILLIPAALARWKDGKAWRLDLGGLARGGAGLAAGLLVYAALPLRALSNAPVNWGNPVTVERFTWLVTGELYQRRLLDMPASGILERLGDAGGLLVGQLGLAGMLLALIGAIYFFKATRLMFLTVWNAAAFTAFAVIYGSADSFLYLIPVMLSAAVWVGLGLGGLLQPAFAYFKGFRAVAAALFGLLLVGTTVERWQKVDASTDTRAEQFGVELMASAPQNALILAEDDASIFTLWYFHFALKQRADLVVMAQDLLHFAWYGDTLRATYPGAAWPEGLLWPQTVAEVNPARAMCTLSSAQGMKLACSTP